jgi:hypothetical protein
LTLPTYHTPTVAAFAWTILLAVVTAVVVFAIAQIGRRINDATSKRPFVVVPVAALAVAGLAIAFAHITGQPDDLVLFSGQESMGTMVNQAGSLSLSTLTLLILFKGVAYGVSLGSARGGPTFPAMFLGIVAGLLCAHLPGYSETPAVAALMGAATVSMLRLPLASIIIAMVVSQAGGRTVPLIIVAVAVAYLTVLALSARQTQPAQPAPADAASTAADGHVASTVSSQQASR